MNFARRWYVFLPLIPLLPYWWLVFAYSTDFPVWDDYDTVLRFLNRYVDTQSLYEKFLLILEQHNEHRIIPLRLFVLTEYWLIGAISLKWLVYVSNIFLTLLYVTICYSLKRLFDDELLHFLLLTAFGFILFQPQYGDGMIWTSTALSSFPVGLFALISFLLLQNRTSLSFVGSIFFAALSTFTQGNGILVPIICVGILLISKRLKEFLIFFLSSGAILACFFIGFQKSQHYGPMDGIRANGVLGVIDYFFTFLGSAWGWSDHYLSLAFGVVFFVLGIIGYLRIGPDKGVPFGGLFAFMACSASLTALIRSASGIAFALSPGRYTVVSVLLSISAISLFVASIKEKRALAVYLIFLISISFSYFSYSWYTVELVKLRDKLVLDVAEWSSGGRGLTFPSFEYADRILRESISKKLYDIPQENYGNRVAENVLINAEIVKEQMILGLNRYSQGERFLLVEGFAFIRKIPSIECEVYLVFDNEKDTIIYKPRMMDRSADIGTRFHNLDRGKAGFLALIPVDLFKADQIYKVGIAVKHGEKVLIRFIERSFPPT